MSTQITIHGKRTETIYPFTVRYKGKTITGRFIRVSGVDEDEPLGLPEEDEIFEYDTTNTFKAATTFFGDRSSTNSSAENGIKQAIKDYEKIHN